MQGVNDGLTENMLCSLNQATSLLKLAALALSIFTSECVSTKSTVLDFHCIIQKHIVIYIVSSYCVLTLSVHYRC